MRSQRWERMSPAQKVLLMLLVSLQAERGQDSDRRPLIQDLNTA